MHQLQGAIHPKVTGLLGEESIGCINLTNLLAQSFHRFEKVCSAFELEVEKGHLNASRPHPRSWLFVGIFDLGNVTKINNAALITTDDHFLNILGSLESADRPNADIALAICEFPAGEVGIGRIDGLAEAGIGDTALRHRGGVDDDVEFGLDRSTNADLRNPIDPLKAGTKATVHEVMKGLGGEIRITGSKTDPSDVIDRLDIDRLNAWLEDAVGITGNFVEFLERLGCGLFDVGPGLELHANGALAIGAG